MFRRAITIALLTCFGLPAAAQCVGSSYAEQLSPAEQAELRRVTDAIPYAQGTLWTATRDSDVITIVGTVHIYDPRLEPLYAQIEENVLSADLVLLEATPAEEAELEQMVITQPDLLFITEGPTLPELLDAETWELIADASTQRGIPGFMAAKMQPWYLSLILSIPPCATQDMLTGRLGLDHMIMAGAEDAGVPMQALESVTTMFDLFTNNPVDEQIDMLMVNLTSPEVQQQLFVSMLDSYFAQEVGALWEMTRIAMAEVPGIDPSTAEDVFAEMEQSLLVTRNHNWMPVITDAVAAHDNLVIAVGAAHLMGEDGILRLLENDGWDLTPFP
ncbi:TraB/GumN family protein [Yoonia sp. BS5-3]|uniref:TraB/GumN family protein n=1 Tax=Yoonia phaeophyticola TaxID=3137369 RepID=A0ABZ2V5X0_9RHOB